VNEEELPSIQLFHKAAQNNLLLYLRIAMSVGSISRALFKSVEAAANSLACNITSARTLHHHNNFWNQGMVHT
jgi:hypothetical protein